ncbi:MAG: hypothetical protein VXZ82_06350 [Planctomycetota bacterium]|nr:hypothetical protein [Planctomycetota bacterium]
MYVTTRSIAIALCLSCSTTIGQDQPAVKLVEIVDGPTSIDPAVVIGSGLDRTATVAFEEASLSEVAQWLQTQVAIPVILNQVSLDEQGILPSELVTVSLREEPLHLLLDRLIGINVSWRFGDGIIQLESVDSGYLETKQLNIGKLIDQGFSADRIINTLQQTIEPDSWDQVGGEGNIILLGDVMFVRQTPLNHRKIKGTLAAFAGFGRRTFILETPVHEDLRKLTESKVDASFTNVPLSDVVAQLGEESGASIVLSSRALRQVGVRARQPMSLKLEAQPLRLALDLIGRDLDLTWQLRNGLLEMTTEDLLEYHTAVYDVRDLCRDDRENLALAQAIVQQTVPQDWMENGGLGVIEFVKPGVMVVYHTQQMQDKTLTLLENYRVALKNSVPRQQEKKEDIVSRRFYRVPTDVAEELQTELPKLTDPLVWKSEQNPESVGEIQVLKSWVGTADIDIKSGAAITVPYSVLVIRQSEKVHRQIAELLVKIQFGEGTLKGAGGMGGMGGSFGGGMFRVTATRDGRR